VKTVDGVLYIGFKPTYICSLYFLDIRCCLSQLKWMAKEMRFAEEISHSSSFK